MPTTTSPCATTTALCPCHDHGRVTCGPCCSLGSTSADRDENRLTEADVISATDAVREALAGRLPTLAERETLMRLAAHSFGCGLHDLRSSEVEQIAAIVEAAMGRRLLEAM